MAHSYRLEGKYELAAPHAQKAFDVTKILLFDTSSRALALSQFLDSGITTFEIYKKIGNQEKAEEALGHPEEICCQWKRKNLIRSITERSMKK